MEKELLKKRYIIQDLRSMYYTNLLVSFAMLVLGIIECLMASRVTTLILSVALVSIAVCALIYIIISLLRISLGNYTIVSDKVVKKLDKRFGLSIFTVKRPCTFVFSKYGKYGIPGKNYTWSKIKQSDRKVYTTTNINDEFYIVRVGKYNAVAYSKNLFTTEDSPSIL